MAHSPPQRRPSLPRVTDEGWLVGTLVEHGKAPYRHDPTARESYYIRVRTLETEQGAQRQRAFEQQSERPIDGHAPHRHDSFHDGGLVERWGQDLERAIRQSRSGVQLGQTVAVKIVAREPIESTPGAPASGATRYWNRWEVETVQFIAQRQRFAQAVNQNRRHARQEGVKGPEALGLYLIQEGAEQVAAARYANAEDRKVFMDRVRNFLAVDPGREKLIARAVARLEAKSQIPSSDKPATREAPTRE